MQFSTSLKQNHVFRKLYAKGSHTVGRLVVVYCRKNGTNGNRLGICASKKLGHAVVRNRMRRRLREIYRHNELKFRSGYDIVIVARSRAVTAEFAQLESETLRQCETLGLLWSNKP